MIDLAVVIVTWNTRELTLEALRSLCVDLGNSGLITDVWVVDSASTDGTAEVVKSEFPQVKLIASEKNLGFAGGNNAALREIGFGKLKDNELPKAVYLLNSDTITQLDATRTLYDVLMSHDRLGVVGARLSYADGSFQHSGFHFPGLKQLWVEFFPTPGRFVESAFNGRYPRRLYESGQPFSVDFTLGATIMLKREVVQQTGMFDEQFFMYCEEIDWAWRIRKAGWEILCVPAAHVIHLGGQSTKQVHSRSIVNLWTSRLLLFRKHYPLWKWLIARGMIALGMWLKARQARNAASLPTAEREALLNAYQTVRRAALNP
jgi:GT2 family glycosyltransferase